MGRIVTAPDDWTAEVYAVYAANSQQTVTQVIAHFSNTGYIDLAVPDDAPVECNLQTIRDDTTVGDEEYFFTYHPAGFSDGLKRPRPPQPCAGNHELPRIVLEIESFRRVSVIFKSLHVSSTCY